MWPFTVTGLNPPQSHTCVYSQPVEPVPSDLNTQPTQSTAAPENQPNQLIDVTRWPGRAYSHIYLITRWLLATSCLHVSLSEASPFPAAGLRLAPEIWSYFTCLSLSMSFPRSSQLHWKHRLCQDQSRCPVHLCWVLLWWVMRKEIRLHNSYIISFLFVTSAISSLLFTLVVFCLTNSSAALLLLFTCFYV